MEMISRNDEYLWFLQGRKLGFTSIEPHVATGYLRVFFAEAEIQETRTNAHHILGPAMQNLFPGMLFFLYFTTSFLFLKLLSISSSPCSIIYHNQYTIAFYFKEIVKTSFINTNNPSAGCKQNDNAIGISHGLTTNIENIILGGLPGLSFYHFLQHSQFNTVITGSPADVF